MFDYVIILASLALVTVIPVAGLALGFALAPRVPNEAKYAAYECGFPSFGEQMPPFDMRFYLVAILFVIFDIETAFLFPWAMIFRQADMAVVLAMICFLGILTVGFVYEWQKGALEWQ